MIEKPDKNEFEEFDDDLDLSYDEISFYETAYGHGYVSSKADGVDFDTEDCDHIVDENSTKNREDIHENISKEDLANLEKEFDEYLKEIASERIRDTNRSLYNEKSLYFSSVSDDLKKTFEIVVDILTRIAQKNGGQIEVNDKYDPTYNVATVTLTGKGFHFENDEQFSAILKFFGYFEVHYADDGIVNFCFVRPDYYNIKGFEI